MSRFADRDFQAFLDADDSIEENDGGNSPTVFKDTKKDSQRFGRPLSAMSASTAADEGGAGMMVGGIQVRMPGQSRPNSASSSRLGSRPTTAQKERSDGRSQSPVPPGLRGRPDSFQKGSESMLGPVDSLRPRSKSPAPEESSKNLGLGPVDMLKGRAPSEKPRSGGLLGLGPTDSLRGRSQSPAPELGSKPSHPQGPGRGRGPSPAAEKAMLGPVDSLRGRSNSPMPQSPASKNLGHGPVDSLRGRSQSPAPGFGIGRDRSESAGFGSRQPSPNPEDSWRDDLSLAGSEDPLAAQGFVALSPSTPSRHEAADSFGSRSFDSPKTMRSDRSGASDPFSPVAAHGRSLAPMSGRLGALSPAGSEAQRAGGPLMEPAQARSRPTSAVRGRREAHEAPTQLAERASVEDSFSSGKEKKEKKQKKEKKEKKHKKDKKDKKDKKEKKRAKDEASEASDSDGSSSPFKAHGKLLEDRGLPQGAERQPAPPPAPRPAAVPLPSSPRPDAVAPPSTQSKAGGKEGQPRALRFLLNFDPLKLTVIWDDAGERKRKVLKVDPDEISEERDQQKLARKLVKKWPFLQEQQTNQVERLLRRLVSRRFPVYRVVAGNGAATADSPEATEKGTRLPPGTMFLAIERTRCASGWWLRLANGCRWLREETVKSCSPSLAEAEEWLHSTRKRTMTRLLELNARLVCSQLATRTAPTAPDSQPPQSKAGRRPGS